MSEETEAEEEVAIARRSADGEADGAGSEPRSERGCRPVLLLILGNMAVVALLFLVWLAWMDRDDPMQQKRTIALLAEIEGGLDDYKLDHGTFPINPAENREEAAIKGAQILYQYLSGDFDLDGEFDHHDPDAKIYVDSLDFKSSQRANIGTVGIGEDGNYMAIDSYGNPIRYLCDPPNRVVGGKQELRTWNPTYDMWSTGKVSPRDDPDEAREKWITNWGAQ